MFEKSNGLNCTRKTVFHLLLSASQRSINFSINTLVVCRYVDRKGLAAMLTFIQLAGVAPEVNLRNSLHAGDKARKRGIHPGFESQGRRHQKSKTGVSVAPRKGLMSSKNLKNKKKKRKHVSGALQLYEKHSPLPDVISSVEAVGVRDIEVVHPDHDLCIVRVTDGIVVSGGVAVNKRSYFYVEEVQPIHRDSVRSCKVK